jgi:hypothetical protein
MYTRFLTALSTLALAGCADLVTGGDLIRSNEPTGTIVLINQSNYGIDTVLISACNAGSYGLDRLAEGEIVAIGGSRAFTVSAGCWDIAGGTVGVGDARKRFQVEAGGTVEYTVTG